MFLGLHLMSQALKEQFTSKMKILESMEAHRTTCGKVVKFGTQVKFNHSNFGVSDSVVLAPPSVQNCTYVYANGATL